MTCILLLFFVWSDLEACKLSILLLSSTTCDSCEILSKAIMPLCYLYTNKKESELKEGIESRIADVVAEVLGKPLERMVITVVPGVRMFRQGTTEPACILNISAVEVFDAQRNPTYSVPIKKLLQDELELSGERCVIVYSDLDKNFIG
ncbi:hypothetical protein Btru_001562 [Bulinus truncatus]|nr:hypothetical protein Btru_001562 [Bulinus truncatus]